MSAADVTDGNSEEVAHGGSEDEAAWLDLIGRFDAPAYSGDEPVPWPASEDVPPAAARDGVSDASAGRSPRVTSAGEGRVTSAPDDSNAVTPNPGGSSGLGPDPDESSGVGPAPDGAGQGRPAVSGDGGMTSAPARGGAAAPGPERDSTVPPALAAGLCSTPPSPPTGGVIPALPPPNGPFPVPGGGPDADPLEDEHFVPPRPPPLRLSPAQKGAWVALFGGPAYLLVATVAGWSLPGWLAIAAIAAFVGGFMTLVLRLGDGHDRDSGPDDGAVV